MDNRAKKIKNLNKALKPPQELGGMFLPENLPEQYDFMFVGEMPSMNEPQDADDLTVNFNFGDFDPRCRFFKEIMVKYGVGGSYVTDIVKERNMPRRPTAAEIKKWLPHLLQEIEIIQPKGIVVIGRTTYDKSFKPLVEPRIPKQIKVDYIFHYSQQGAKTKAEIEKKFREVVNRIKKA